MTTATTTTRYAIFTIDPTSRDEDEGTRDRDIVLSERLEAVVDADSPSDAIRSHLSEMYYPDDAEYVGLVAFEVSAPSITVGAVRYGAGDSRYEVDVTMSVGPETYRGTAVLSLRESDGVWDSWGDSIDMWLGSYLIDAVDAAEALDEGTRDIVLSELIATARRAIRRASSRVELTWW